MRKYFFCRELAIGRNKNKANKVIHGIGVWAELSKRLFVEVKQNNLILNITEL